MKSCSNHTHTRTHLEPLPDYFSPTCKLPRGDIFGAVAVRAESREAEAQTVDFSPLKPLKPLKPLCAFPSCP